MPDMLSHHWAWAAREGDLGLDNWSDVGRHWYYDQQGELKKWPNRNMHGWQGWYDNADRVVHVTRCQLGNVSIVLSTIFTAYDLQSAQSRAAGGLPVLWETLVFGGLHDGKCERYRALKDAKAGHERWYNKIMGLTTLDPSIYVDNDVAVAWAEPQPVPRPVEDDKPQWRKARTLSWDKSR